MCVCVRVRTIVCGLFSAGDEPKHRSVGVIGAKRGRGGEEGPCVGEREGPIKNGTRKLFVFTAVFLGVMRAVALGRVMGGVGPSPA